MVCVINEHCLFTFPDGSIEKKKWTVCREFHEAEYLRGLGFIPPTREQYTPLKMNDCKDRDLLKRMDFTAGNVVAGKKPFISADEAGCIYACEW